MTKDVPHILLVNPWIHDFAAYDFWAKPLGLLSLAALLRSHGVAVTYIDCLDRFHPKAPTGDPSARYGPGTIFKSTDHQTPRSEGCPAHLLPIRYQAPLVQGRSAGAAATGSYPDDVYDDLLVYRSTGDHRNPA